MSRNFFSKMVLGLFEKFRPFALIEPISSHLISSFEKCNNGISPSERSEANIGMAAQEYDGRDDSQAVDNSLILEFSDDSDETTDEESTDEDEDDRMMYYERAIKEIARGSTYVCMICTVEMDYTCKMFACSKCYRVFDYDCIREWALKSTGRTMDKTWKCPNCFHESKSVPRKGRPTCWCGKVVNPDPNPLDPNSCGQTCDAPICEHGCSKVCHIGPHPECARIISIRCKCGRHTKDVRCSEASSGGVSSKHQHFTCEEECGLLLPCGIHKCSKKCHSGLCGGCNETLHSNPDSGAVIKCYCGLHERSSIRCGDVRVADKDSSNDQGNSWIGVFRCKDVRVVEYACGHHSFVESCKPAPSLSRQKRCPFAPEVLRSCPCGRTPLNQLGQARSKCTDHIPTCESKCGKKLACGKHICPFKCHEGDCMDPCLQFDKTKCLCESRSFLVPCQFHEDPRCNTKCESLMSCRRHRCVERCCSGKPGAERRKKTPFSSRELLDESIVEAEHVCLKGCNLTLTCGRHKCQRKCHPGKCPPSLESDPNDLVCPCGKTIVEAPVRCGTKLPPCPYPCISVVRDGYPCGHTPMPHLCHPPEEQCPPCTATVRKPCKCGKKNDVRTLCFQQDVSCGQICSKPLSSCHHTCQKRCHEGDCQTKCKQICGKKRVNCNHKCPKPCHAGEPCPDFPCPISVVVKCACGRKESTEPCGSNSQMLGASDIRQLPCDEECERVKRCAQLKDALGLGEKGDSSAVTTESEALVASSFEELGLPFKEAVMSIYSRQQRYCDSIESILNNFIDDGRKSSLHFKPMRPPQRHFVHELAKAYQLYSESQDPEPKRSVYVKKELNGESGKPSISLQEALPIYQAFKQREKESKIRRYEMQSVTNLVNFVPKFEPTVELAKSNGFLIRNVTQGTDEEDLERIYGEHLRPTLVKNPIYRILSDRNIALIFPESYLDVTVNTERDLERLVGHFDFICKEMFIGDGVELCQVDEYLQLETPTESS